MRNALLAAVLLGAALPARAQSTATLRGIDVYRSAVLPSAAARARFEARLLEYVGLVNLHKPGLDDKAEKLRAAMEKEAASLPGVAQAELRVTEYFTSVDHGMYAMFDVVDKADASRLAFTPAPKGSVEDPEGVLSVWRGYVARGDAYSRRGELPIDRPDCPGFYCLWGGKPELDAAHKTFAEAAAKHAEDLRRVLREDVDAEKRSDALFVLSYLPNGRDVAGLCHEALQDSDPKVRGAALQILADLAARHSEIPLALDRILPRLDDPISAVRGKTMGLLVPLFERDAYRQVAMGSAPRLAALLRVQHPESRDLAFTLLGILSKKSFDKQDFASWDAWAAKAAVGKP